MTTLATSLYREPFLRLSAGAWLLAGVLLGEVVGWIVFAGHTPRAVVVTGLLALGAGVTACHVGRGRDLPMPRLYVTDKAVLAGFAIIGFVALAMGVLEGNGLYYIGADLYHWFVEGLAVAVVTIFVFGRAEASHAARAVAVIGLLVGVVCMAAFVLGTLGWIEEGVHVVPNLGLARLILGRGTPQVILILVVAALWHHRRWDATTRAMLIAGTVLLMLALALTLKRTTWLSLPFALAFVMLPRRGVIALAVTGAAVALIVGALLLTAPRAVDSAVQWAGSVLTYNPSFTIEDTLSRRGEQLASVWPAVTDRPNGHGLGASIHGYDARTQQFTEIHYIHNLYAYYLVQLGIPLSALMAVMLSLLGWTWLRRDDPAQAWSFAARGGLGSLAALLINGLSLVPTHTAFAGFAIGLGMLGSARQRGGARR